MIIQTSTLSETVKYATENYLYSKMADRIGIDVAEFIKKIRL